MELRMAVEGRRSIRMYTQQQVESEVLAKLLDEACWAPSAVNRQPWYFVVVKSDEKMKKLLSIMSVASHRIRAKLEERFAKYPEVVRSTRTFVESLGGAPAGILVFLNQDYGEQNSEMVQSTAAAIQNFCLLAYEQGLSTCWLAATNQVEAEIREEFGIDKGPCVALLTVGYGAQEVKAPKRHQGKYEFV